MKSDLLYTLGARALVQDLDPDDLALQLMVRHKAQVVAQMLLAVEGLDPAAVVTQPILLIYSY